MLEDKSALFSLDKVRALLAGRVAEDDVEARARQLLDAAVAKRLQEGESVVLAAEGVTAEGREMFVRMAAAAERPRHLILLEVPRDQVPEEDRATVNELRRALDAGELGGRGVPDRPAPRGRLRLRAQADRLPPRRRATTDRGAAQDGGATASRTAARSCSGFCAFGIHPSAPSRSACSRRSERRHVRDQDDRGRRRALAELAHELAGVGDVGEHEVEQQRVRAVTAQLVDRLAPRARRRDDLHVAVLLEHLAEEQLHGERVIADRHADRPVHRT